jgi:hypothetical protein
MHLVAPTKPQNNEGTERLLPDTDCSEMMQTASSAHAPSCYSTRRGAWLQLLELLTADCCWIPLQSVWVITRLLLCWARQLTVFLTAHPNSLLPFCNTACTAYQFSLSPYSWWPLQQSSISLTVYRVSCIVSSTSNFTPDWLDVASRCHHIKRTGSHTVCKCFIHMSYMTPPPL